MNRLRRILIAIALLLGAAGAARAQDVTGVIVAPDTTALHHYADGVRLSAEERYEEAIARFERALALASDHDPSHYELSRALATLGRNAEAEPHSARAVELDPDNRWYREQRGHLLVSLERYDEATEVFKAIVADRGSFDPDNYRMLALLYHRAGRTDDALATLSAAEERMGSTPRLIDMKRGLLIEAGRIDDAAAITEAYIAATPYDEESRLVLAQIYAHQGRDSLRVATLKRVVEINPHNAEALSALADAYMAGGQDKLSLATLAQLFTLPSVPPARKKEMVERLTGNINFYRANYHKIGELALMLVTQNPRDASVVEAYAVHALRGGEEEGALGLLKDRIGRMDAPLTTYLMVIQIEARQKRVDSVELWSDRALERFPAAMDVHLLRAGIQQYFKRYPEAQRTLDGALRAADTDSLRSEVWGAIGTLWHERGNDRKTFSAYKKALRYGADNALVLNNYAYFLSEDGRELDRAKKMAERAVELNPGIASYYDTYAWVLYKSGDYAGAKRVMQQALPLDREGNPELLFHYGDILWALGDEFMATVYWKQARDAGYEQPAEIEERLGRTTK